MSEASPISSDFNFAKLEEWDIHGLYNEYTKQYSSKENPMGQYLWKFYYKKFSMIQRNRRVYETEDEWMKSHKKVIEKYLFENGYAMIFDHPLQGRIVTRGNITQYDVNGFPAKQKPVYEFPIEGISDYKEELSINNTTQDKKCVFIYDTEDWLTHSIQQLGLIRDIVDIDLAIRTQCLNQQTPLLGFISNDSDVKPVEKTIRKINSGANILIMSRKNKDIIDNLQQLDFKQPFNVEGLQNQKNERINQLLQFMGVDNQTATVKKERMVVDEVESNNELLTYTLRSYIDQANEGQENMKKIFGVDYKVTIGDIERPDEREQEKAGNENEDKQTE